MSRSRVLWWYALMQRAWCVYMGISFVQPPSSQPLSEDVGHWLQTHYRRGELGCNSQQSIGRCSIGEPLSNDAQLQRQSWIYFNTVNLGMKTYFPVHPMHQVRLFGRTHVAYTIPIVDITMEFAASCIWMCKSQDIDGRLQHNLANNYLLLLLLWLLLQLATAILLAMETATASMGRPGTASFFYKLLFIISDSFFQGVQNQGLQPQSPAFQLPGSPWETGTQSDACRCI